MHLAELIPGSVQSISGLALRRASAIFGLPSILASFDCREDRIDLRCFCGRRGRRREQNGGRKGFLSKNKR